MMVEIRCYSAAKVQRRNHARDTEQSSWGWRRFAVGPALPVRLIALDNFDLMFMMNEEQKKGPVMVTKYLVTGGAGFIGSHIADTLLNQGESVRVFDNFSTGRQANLSALQGRAEFLHGDIRNFDAVKTAMTGVEV